VTADTESFAIECVKRIRVIATVSDGEETLARLRSAINGLQTSTLELFRSVLPKALESFGQEEAERKDCLVLGKEYSSYAEFVTEWSVGILEVASKQIGIDVEAELERIGDSQANNLEPDIAPLFAPTDLMSLLSQLPAEYQKATLANSDGKGVFLDTVFTLFKRHFLGQIATQALANVDFGLAPHFTFAVDRIESQHVGSIVEAAQIGSVLREGKRPIADAAARAWLDSDFDMLLSCLRPGNVNFEKASAMAGAVDEKGKQGSLSFPLKVFVSYSHADEQLLRRLLPHLASLRNQGRITDWHDRRSSAGTDWKGKIDENLLTAHVILMLVSSDFLQSEYCQDVEMRQALDRHSRNEARLVPIFLRPCDWEHEPFAAIQGLPKDAKPVTRWSKRDLAYTDIARGLRLIIDELCDARSSG
jgi:hypothetical protein